MLSIQVVSEEVRPLPIVRQLDAVESIICECSGDLLEIEEFFLPGIQRVIGNEFEFRHNVAIVIEKLSFLHQYS